ncbi:hypothetical protein [Polyangium jinanense]|uniref:Uncharacterized protein n=1 Tax=Polyangium jinanense TaxID=2829994 RepID=A0A9X3XIP2_9BACT|nr:hypothetical protein [Polyangium jinanense]MDC3962005.1 hypothetical protein [Polyangium jinanense]MDC3988901.1 hypothetical protein [Polyangium jinanense]
MRYRIPRMGNPGMDLALRAKYIAAFGSACYLSEGPTPTFNCFYKTPQEACDEGVRVAEVFGAAPYDKNYPACEPIAGTENYFRQVGPDPAIHIVISYEPAPRQTPLVEVDGVPTEVSGPYRNLPEPPTLGPAQPFNKCDSGVLGADGKPLLQHTYILQVNRNAHKNDADVGEIHSDLAGFKWPCTVMNENCEEVAAECEEPLVLYDPADKKAPFHPGSIARVHHVVPMKDKRSCPWGTNSTKNAAVISHALNQYLLNNDPPAEEVKRLNNAPAYTP